VAQVLHLLQLLEELVHLLARDRLALDLLDGHQGLPPARLLDHALAPLRDLVLYFYFTEVDVHVDQVLDVDVLELVRVQHGRDAALDVARGVHLFKLRLGFGAALGEVVGSGRVV